MPRVRMLRRVLAKSSAASRAGEFLDHLGGDQGQLVPGPVRAAGTERAGAVGVAVALQATAGECAGLLDQLHGRFGERCDGEQLHDAGQRGAFLCHGEHGVERRDGVGAADVEVGGGPSEQRRVLRAEDDAGWCPEREDGDLPLGAVGEGAVGWPSTMAIHQPAHWNERGSAIGTMPKPRPASQLFHEASACVTGRSSSSGSSASGTSVTEDRQAARPRTSGLAGPSGRSIWIIVAPEW